MDRQTFKTEIDGYEVELEIDSRQEPPTQCFVGKPGRRGSWTHSASLAALQGEGYLAPCADRGEDHIVHGNTIDRISDWAEENGY